MDISALRTKIPSIIKKYRYAILILLLGIGLMAIPQRETARSVPTDQVTETIPDDSEALREILCQIHGAGRVKVLLTRASGETVVYQVDQDSATASESGSVRYETVIVTDADRAENGLVQKTLAPEYRGAIVVCEGADDPKVRLSIVEAVSNATGLKANQISVLKIK